MCLGSAQLVALVSPNVIYATIIPESKEPRPEKRFWCGGNSALKAADLPMFLVQPGSCSYASLLSAINLSGTGPLSEPIAASNAHPRTPSINRWMQTKRIGR